MATLTELSASHDDANSQNYTATLSRAIGAGKRGIAVLLVSGSAPTDTATLTGGGVTFTERHTVTQFGRTTVFTWEGTGSPSGTSIAIDTGYASATAGAWWFGELDGDDDNEAGWQYAGNVAGGGAATDVTVTLASAPAADSLCIAFAAVNKTAAFGFTSGFAEEHDGAPDGHPGPRSPLPGRTGADGHRIGSQARHSGGGDTHPGNLRADLWRQRRDRPRQRGRVSGAARRAHHLRCVGRWAQRLRLEDRWRSDRCRIPRRLHRLHHAP